MWRFLIPGQGTKILHATWCGQNKKSASETQTLRESWIMNVVVLNSALLNIVYDFRVVKNSCERIRTIFSIGLWKEYTCNHRFMLKRKGLRGQCLTLFLLIKKISVWLASRLIMNIFSVVLFLFSWWWESGVYRWEISLVVSAHSSVHVVGAAPGNGCHQCLCPQGEPQPLLAFLRDSARQAESSEIWSILGIHTTVSFAVNTWTRALNICRS